MQVADLKKMTTEELEKELLNVRQESFNMRMQAGSGESVKPHLIENARRNIARIKTLIREKQVNQND